MIPSNYADFFLRYNIYDFLKAALEILRFTWWNGAGFRLQERGLVEGSGLSHPGSKFPFLIIPRLSQSSLLAVNPRRQPRPNFIKSITPQAHVFIRSSCQRSKKQNSNLASLINLSIFSWAVFCCCISTNENNGRKKLTAWSTEKLRHSLRRARID